MPTHVLRSFLYLDKQMVDDFLASLEGALYDETIVETQEKTGAVSGEGSVAIFKGGGKAESKKTTEVTKQVSLTDTAKFQRLYAHLEREGVIGYYETMNTETWSTIYRNALLEAFVNASLTNIGFLSAAVKSFSDLAQALKTMTGESFIDEEKERLVQGFETFAKIEADKGIPVVMTLFGSPEYKLISYLNPGSLRVPKERIVGEVTIFCKVQRKLENGESFDLFDPLFMIDKLPLNRKQRRKRAKKKLPPEFRNTIKAPAAVVIPIAIYR